MDLSNDWELVPPLATDTANHTDLSPTKGHKQDDIVGILASTLIPGKGKPIKDQAILCSRKTGKIIYVGFSSQIPPKYYNVHLQEIPVVMPGMWECHAHFMGASPNKPINSENLALTDPAETGARNVRALKDTLYAGFTSAVELGGYATELQRVIEEGSILGPTLYGAGAAISMTAGHGDIFE
jgi:imidazolonepropionase-like amidohydrolase